MQQKKLKVSQDVLAIHQRLVGEICTRIEQNSGAIHFQDFMQMALYLPQYGYYQNELCKLGEQGDFITAPEMGTHFAVCIANSLAALDTESRAQIIEVGAGSGALAIDLLLALAANDQLPKQYYILEPSANLQALQKQNIAKQLPEEIFAQVRWLKDLPDDFTGTVIANEVVDAIPCERIIRAQSGWHYQGVTWTEEIFQWKTLEIVKQQHLPETLMELNNYQLGYTTEIRPLVSPWIERLSRCVRQGWVMLFDYGYPQREFYHPQRTEGSLRCFSRHQAHSSALELVGLQDITGHVDFTELAKAAVASGFDVSGFTTQSGFLLETGILDSSLSKIESENSKARYLSSQQIQKLITPGQMGEVIKVIAFSKATDDQPAGFTLQDHLHRL